MDVERSRPRWKEGRLEYQAELEAAEADAVHAMWKRMSGESDLEDESDAEEQADPRAEDDTESEELGG